MKRQDSIHYKKLNNIKSDKAKIITYDEAVFKLDTSLKNQAQYDNINDTVIIPASELKPYSETQKENNKSKEKKLYFYCSYKLDGTVNNKYYMSTSIKSARNNIHNISLRYKKLKGYDNVEFKILEFKQISMAEYENFIKK